MTKTHMERTLNVSNGQIEYDEHAKNLISDKLVLAWIMKSVVEEVKGMSINAIIACIGDNIEVSKIPVNPGETNRPEKILGDRTEDSVPYEGEITYDIRFHLWIPGKKKY